MFYYDLTQHLVNVIPLLGVNLILSKEFKLIIYGVIVNSIAF